MTEVKAKLSRLTVSPYKVRLVADQIRGKRVEEAIDILSFRKKASASNVLKLLESAIANAENQTAGKHPRPMGAFLNKH